MTTRSRLTYIVPTVGRSPYLQACLEALAANSTGPILLVVEASADLSDLDLPTEVTRLIVPDSAGFSMACNTAIAGSESEFVALVNDDALVEQGWAESLIHALESDSRLAAVQGTNLRLADTRSIDGCGIGWNRSWQAVQIGRGTPVPRIQVADEIFGVSCTAALMRRSALETAALAGNQYFDTVLGTYYEDVELACRLRAHGHTARLVPQARARHAGSTSSSQDLRWRWTQIYGNRLLVLARLWGRSFPLRFPRLLARDCLDLIRAATRLRSDLVVGIFRGWGRAALRLPSYAHRGAPMLSMTELHRFQLAGTQEAVVS